MSTSVRKISSSEEVKMVWGDTSTHLSEFQMTKFKYMFSAFFDIEEVKILSLVAIHIELQHYSYGQKLSKFLLNDNGFLEWID